jgi:hypothetical protein
MDIARTKAEDDEVEDVDAAVAADTEGEPKTVWIAIGPASYSENPYAPKEVWNSSGW